MNIEIDFGHVLAQERVKRWHIVAAVREQTLPEHAAMVTYIAEKILSLIPMEGVTSTNIEGITLLTIQMALYHDCHEVLTGDLPSVRKKYVLDQEIMPSVVVALQKTFVRRYGQKWFNVISAVLKVADIAEAIRFITKYGVPSPHKTRVVAGLMASLEKAIGILWRCMFNLTDSSQSSNAVRDAVQALISKYILTEDV